MKKLVEKVKNSRFVKYSLEYYKVSEMDLSSIAVAYYMILTIFPFLVLLANLFPYLNIDTAEILNFMRENLPKELYNSTASLVINVFNNPSTSLLWLSILTGLWTMSRSMIFLQKSINKAYGVQDHRDIVLGHIVGMFSSLLVVFFLTFAILLSTFGKTILRLLNQTLHINDKLYNLLMYLTQPVTGLVFFVALAILYYILPNVKIRKIRYILPGSIFTTLVLMTLTSLFGNYVNYAMDRMDNLRVFGSVAVFVLMLWFIFFAKILIMGSIFNASYQKRFVKDFETRRGNVIEIIQSRREEKNETK